VKRGKDRSPLVKEEGNESVRYEGKGKQVRKKRGGLTRDGELSLLSTSKVAYAREGTLEKTGGSSREKKKKKGVHSGGRLLQVKKGE